MSRQTSDTPPADVPAGCGPAAADGQRRRRPGAPRRPGPVGPPRYALRLAFGLQAAIAAGDALAMVALASRVYEGSHASWAVAAVFLAITIPITALAPLAGLLLDRLPPRPVLIAAAAAEAVVALALTRVPGIGPVLALATGFGVCAAVLQPGLGAIVPQLVGPPGEVGQASRAGQASEAGQASRADQASQADQASRADQADRADQAPQLDRADQADRVDPTDRADWSGRSAVTRANGYLQAATSGGFTVGPLLAGALTAAGGTGLALAGVAVIYALGALGLWALPLAPPDRTAGPGHPVRAGANGQGGLAAQLGAGLRFLREDTDAGLLVLVVGVAVVFAYMAVVAEVAFAESVLNAGPTGYSVLIAAWTAGMLVGTLAGGRLPERRLAVTTLAGTLAMGAGVALAGAAAFLWQAAAAYAFGGLANGMEVVATRSFLNHRAPPEVAGRVFAVYSGVLFGAASVGMAAAGGLLGSASPRLVLFLAGGGGLAVAGVGWFLYARRHARRARSHQARPAAAARPPAATRPASATPDAATPTASTAPASTAPASTAAASTAPASAPDQRWLTPASRGQPPAAQPDRADRG